MNNVNFTFRILCIRLFTIFTILFAFFSCSYIPHDLTSFSVFFYIGFVPQTQGASTDTEIHHFIMSSSEVPASPANIAEGGKASLQPKRTPVSEREIEAVLVSNGFFPFM